MLVLASHDMFVLASLIYVCMVQFDVERREVDTRVEICCARNPGLLLSILSTLEMLGLEIQQCVISCFNDFGMQASCFEVSSARELALQFLPTFHSQQRRDSVVLYSLLPSLSTDTFCCSCLLQHAEQRALVSSEDMKQALFRNAGYGG